MKHYVLALLALSLPSCHATTYIYACKDHGKVYPLKVDDTKNVLLWKGETYSLKEQDDCGRMGWHAEKDGASFDFCTATQGYADIEKPNGEKIECGLKR